MLAGYSYAEINFLDAWAKFIIFQYSLQAYRQWITGETMDSAKSLRDYWFSTCAAPAAACTISSCMRAPLWPDTRCAYRPPTG